MSCVGPKRSKQNHRGNVSHPLSLRPLPPRRRHTLSKVVITTTPASIIVPINHSKFDSCNCNAADIESQHIDASISITSCSRSTDDIGSPKRPSPIALCTTPNEPWPMTSTKMMAVSNTSNKLPQKYYAYVVWFLHHR